MKKNKLLVLGVIALILTGIFALASCKKKEYCPNDLGCNWVKNDICGNGKCALRKGGIFCDCNN